MAFEAFRQRIGSIIGGFDAAQAHRRLRGFRASRTHVNTLNAVSGDTITARARWLVRNNGYAANAMESFASNVVGDGIKPSSTIMDAAKKEELQALWLAWTDDADAEGVTDFYGLPRRAPREVFMSGAPLDDDRERPLAASRVWEVAAVPPSGSSRTCFRKKNRWGMVFYANFFAAMTLALCAHLLKK